MGRIIIGIVLVLLGVGALFGVSLLQFAFAFVLIAIGIRILSGKSRRNWNLGSHHSSTSEDMLNEVAIFSPVNKTVHSDNFKGGKVVVVFGGGQIDISQVKTQEKTVNMELVAVFGGIKMIIPKGWKVNSQGAAVFGGYDSKVTAGNDDVTLNLKGAAVFGGIEILN